MAREVADVSGAGDTVIATLAAGLAAGLGCGETVQLANIAAAIVVGKRGTVPVHAEELVAQLTQSTKTQAAEKLLDLERLKKRVAEWRATGETIVFTNGCFDILHVGHITLLEQCRRFGSKLIVGMNTDASVCALKGPSRPIVGERERARIMAALAATDAVVLFNEETPMELIRALRAGCDREGRRLHGGERRRARGRGRLGRTGGDRAHGGRLLDDEHREEDEQLKEEKSS